MGHQINFFLMPEDTRLLEKTLREECSMLMSVEPDCSPAIQLSRCYYDGTILRRGRLHYQRRFVEGGAWVKKPEAFQSWARKVFAVARKTLQKLPDRPFYVGPRTLAEHQQGRVRLVF